MSSFALYFQLSNGNAELLETPYSATLEELINLHLKCQHSFPVFLSAITVDLFSRQTIASDEHVTVS
jgi:mitotic spindle assembly checkpoint protein MAD1